MKSPKEKAKELVNKYIIELNYKLPLKDCDYLAEQCALIAVDEIIKELQNNLYDSYYYYRQEDYWEEVKQEIKKL